MNNIIDPWNLSKEFLLNFDEKNIIKGPCKVIKILIIKINH